MNLEKGDIKMSEKLTETSLEKKLHDMSMDQLVQ